MKSIDTRGVIKSTKTIDSCMLKKVKNTDVIVPDSRITDQIQHHAMYAISAVFDLFFCVFCFGILVLCLVNNANILLSATIALIIAVARPMTAATKMMVCIIRLFKSNVCMSRRSLSALTQCNGCVLSWSRVYCGQKTYKNNEYWYRKMDCKSLARFLIPVLLNY